MAIQKLQGTYHNMPVIFHQEDGRTVNITPGRFCPACQEPKARTQEDGARVCTHCGREYYVPTQAEIDAAK